MTPSVFEFDWDEARGLDLHLVEWESRAMKGTVDSAVLEISQALYSAFGELRKIRKIYAEGRPGIEHSFYQVRFELFAQPLFGRRDHARHQDCGDRFPPSSKGH